MMNVFHVSQMQEIKREKGENSMTCPAFKRETLDGKHINQVWKVLSPSPLTASLAVRLGENGFGIVVFLVILCAWESR